ncbi:DNA alkylation repair protein [Listeria monocytogenes]|uniref:DNA alkylation repair protein n=1 Tax=Listeria monocytogenes TaxID=1639 RepID=UPI0010D3CB80|nr:DNA alkylation repair protein [Listeria monocytogenes]EAC7885261.1 DNA alkylation repair protein [Listeria monocytogenes]EAE1303194.1 DNA alkylation repair protein [Listeria monocytogenes]EAF0970693.1 DNA alkylation repair protein [Listeria monocytogenes]EAO7443433.1 DNA alkylation repair protein [Listeria monocytogenes]EJA0793308.1 DNA alkylation repair protein [Listeria monocytogenes]
MITFDELNAELQALENPNTIKIFRNHGCPETLELYGLKIGDLKKIIRREKLKKNHELAIELIESNNSDLIYLGLLAINPNKITIEQIEKWNVAFRETWSQLTFGLASVVSKRDDALLFAKKWIESDYDLTKSMGWQIYSEHINDLPEAEVLLQRAKDTLQTESNRTRYSMNNFIISCGIYNDDLHEKAIEVATSVGKVHVNLGNTSCKVPDAISYIEKARNRTK